MIKRVVKRKSLRDSASLKDDLEYWLSKPPEERVAADVVVHYIGRNEFISNKRAIGRKKDLADLEALGEE